MKTIIKKQINLFKNKLQIYNDATTQKKKKKI